MLLLLLLFCCCCHRRRGKESKIVGDLIRAADYKTCSASPIYGDSEAAMGISSLPAPSEGILTLILVNTAFSISIFKKIAVFLLDFLRPVRSPSADSDDDPAHDSLTDRFRLRARASRYGSHDPSCGPADCRVCLGRFDLESVVNRLPCGHLFHKVCLERWLDYHHFTCPLCRTQLLPPVCASS